MARYIETIRTDLSAEESFAYLAAVENFRRWDPGVREATQVVGEGPGLGSEYDVTVSGIGRPLVLRYRVLSYEPPRRVVIEARTRTLRSLDTVTVVPRDGGSAVTYDARLLLRGPLRVADPILAIMFRRIGRRAGAGLRAALTRTHPA